MTGIGEWRRRGTRTGADLQKRRTALEGALLVVPVLLLGALLWRFASPSPGELVHPLAYVLSPVVDAWRADRDLALAAYVALQMTLLSLPAALFGGALHRLAAVDLATGTREGRRAALAFAAQRFGRFLRMRMLLVVMLLLPVALLVLLAVAWGRTEGWVMVLLAPIVVLLLAALLTGTVGSFVPAASIASEDLGVCQAVSRAGTFVGAGPFRVLGLRVRFLASALVASLPRLLLGGGLLAGLVLTGRGLWPDAFLRARAVIGAAGAPPDAERLGVAPVHFVLATLFLFGLAVVLLLWLADLLSRVVSLRVALFLALREEVLGLAPSHLVPGAAEPEHRSAEVAGFVEIGRVP